MTSHTGSATSPPAPRTRSLDAIGTRRRTTGLFRSALAVVALAALGGSGASATDGNGQSPGSTDREAAREAQENPEREQTCPDSRSACAAVDGGIAWIFTDSLDLVGTMSADLSWPEAS